MNFRMKLNKKFLRCCIKINELIKNYKLISKIILFSHLRIIIWNNNNKFIILF